VLATAAAANDLPVEFFTRLIWQESRFKPEAVSRAGAQGVAQFMPGTARLRGLEDPFDPIQAIAKSAQLLRDLRLEFGNLGLAAAAYNAGPGRVRDWLGGRRPLPRETQAYVRLVTGHSAEEWAAGQKNFVEMSVATGVACSLGAATLEQPIPRASPPKAEPIRSPDCGWHESARPASCGLSRCSCGSVRIPDLRSRPPIGHRAFPLRFRRRRHRSAQPEVFPHSRRKALRPTMSVHRFSLY
jgi:Transglycosylase SLT domain